MHAVTDRSTLQLASRIDAGLRQHLGEGIDLQRTVSDALYQRDVLLVCDACAPGELSALATQFRAALTAKAPAAGVAAIEAPAPESSTGPDSGGFSPSRFFNSLFGAWHDHAEGGARHHSKARQRGGWFGR